MLYLDIDKIARPLTPMLRTRFLTRLSEIFLTTVADKEDEFEISSDDRADKMVKILAKSKNIKKLSKSKKSPKTKRSG